MALYICKCGRQVNKSTNADNTGNRDTDGCTGCPYLLPWGPDKYIEGQGFTKDVQGYECRMSPTISYTTTYNGQANDKCTLHILSLDLDFMDEVQAWIYDNAADTLSAGFSRGSMRGTDFSNKGRYSLSISCAQNKKGMAAKAALIEQFFTGGRVRKDMTLVQEKAHILDAIRKGKEQAQRKDTAMKKLNDRCPLQQECERTCKAIGHERDCDYYVNNRYCTEGIPDQDELLTEEELWQEREREERYLASLSAEPAEPVVYQNEYGTLFAVREHKGAPALMCKAKEADSWALSGVLAAVQGEAYTAADQQKVLDEYARAHGWKKAAPEQTKEDYSPCEGCRCPDCDDEACPQAHCDKSDKGLGCIAPDGLCPPVNPTDAAADAPPCAPTVSDAQPLPSPNADAGAKEDANDCKADGAASQNCPFYDVKEYSDNSEGHFCHLCGSLKRPHKVCLGKYKDDWHKCDVFIKYDGAEQLLTRNASSSLSATIQTTPTIVESSDIADDGRATSRPCPGDVYRSAKGGQLYKIGELTNGKKTCYLTMRCNVQGGIWVPANSSVYPNLSDAQGEFEAWIRREQLEPVAPTMDAAAITDELAAKDPFKAGETSTVSPENSLDVSSCPSAEPASLEAKDINVPTFDFGADDDTNAALMQDAQIFMAGSMARVMAAKRAHDRTANNYRGSWGKWCDLVGISRDTGDNMVRVAEQFGNIQIDGQNLIDIQPLKLLYAASKPSTPPEIRERVENLDITTYKQYQDAMTRIRTLENQNASLLHSYETERGKAEAADRRADAAQTERDAADTRARAAEKERDEACKERDGAKIALQASKLRGDRLKAENDDLKARPIEVPAVDEEEIDRRVNARLQQAVYASQGERRQIDARNAEDAILLLGRQINTAWQMVRPYLAEMEESRRVEAIDRINREWAQTQKEIMQCL